MTEEKRLILTMLKEGKITEEEALKLLDSINEKENFSRSKDDDFSAKEEKFENSVNNFVTKIFDGIEFAFNRAGEAISESDFNFSNISFDFSNQKGKVTKTLRIDDLTDKINLFINNKNGKVEVEAWDNDYIECDAKIRFDDRQLRGDEDFVMYKQEDNNHFIGINNDLNRNDFNIKFTVSAPKDRINDLKIQTTNGKIEISYLNLNELEAGTANAKIELAGIVAKSIDANTSNAKIEANNITSEDIIFNTSNAKVDINDITSHKLSVNTTNGKLVLVRINSEIINGKNTNGSIQTSLIADKSKQIDLSSTNGGIYIENIDFTRPVMAEFYGRDTGNLSDHFVSLDRSGRITHAYTENYNDEAEDKLKIKLTTTNGRVSII